MHIYIRRAAFSLCFQQPALKLFLQSASNRRLHFGYISAVTPVFVLGKAWLRLLLFSFDVHEIRMGMDLPSDFRHGWRFWTLLWAT